MSKASNLAGFVTSITPINSLNAGIVTATSFVGNVTGSATYASTAGVSTVSQGLTGTPNINVGIVTATTISTGGTTGTSGQVLQSTGTGVTWSSPTGGISATDSNLIGYNSAGIRSDNANGRLAVFGLGNFQVFTSPGTYVVSPGISSIRVRVVGAGGNGGDYSPPLGSPTSMGGGGGGGYAHKVITSFTAPRSYSVTVGSSPGGTSSFGSEVSATGGGTGGQGFGGPGGNGSGGDFNASGAAGEAVTPRSGGAAGSQKGNASGGSIAGIPGQFFPENARHVRRFPFDTFEGYTGANSLVYLPAGNAAYLSGNGFEGGAGLEGPQTLNPGIARNGGTGAGGGSGGPTAGAGGKGGIGGGGGGGLGGIGGAGGSGIVIVEW